MALIVETGVGIAGAESYNSVAAISAYWVKRGHTSFATAWAAATTANHEGAAREATDFLDAEYGAFYRGTRKGYVQGKMWPRTSAQDGTGYYLPAMPPELKQAHAELAGRAISGRLSEDAALSGSVASKTVKAGPVSTTTSYEGGTSIEKKFGFLDGIMAPLLDRVESGSSASWAWR